MQKQGQISTGVYNEWTKKLIDQKKSFDASKRTKDNTKWMEGVKMDAEEVGITVDIFAIGDSSEVKW